MHGMPSADQRIAVHAKQETGRNVRKDLLPRLQSQEIPTPIEKQKIPRDFQGGFFVFVSIVLY
ncbi:MAG: hypothetical protein A3F26_00530 [Candidatus Ryanbacteria bacterium RIFCSPHIGHO2_12_FULL_47_12b]|nr:MAG: hypothetical protein A3F26_00530 [Candidatus Ryanbacteria bacterium RIFCSPHIGHO2_12_FULL_47_12b]